MIKKFIVILSFMFFLPHAIGKEFVVSYAGFYDRMKVMDKGNYSTVEVGFYLVDMKGEICDIERGLIITENKEFPLSFTPAGKLLLPFDETLDKDKAVIVAHPRDKQLTCQLKLQIESVAQYYNSISQHQVFVLHNEFDDLIGRLSGFFMRTLFAFLMPEVTGVTLIFDDKVELSGDAKNVSCSNKRCIITPNSDWEESKLTFHFSQNIKQVIPYITK